MMSHQAAAENEVQGERSQSLSAGRPGSNTLRRDVPDGINDMTPKATTLQATPPRATSPNAATLQATPPKVTAPTHSKTRDLVRYFRLQFLAPLLFRITGSRWNASTEHRKIAIHHNRAVAATYSLLHLVPLGGAVALLVFQWTNLWVGSTDRYSTTLQFAAKAHELAMQASIIEVLLCLVRTRLVNGAVPLGALSCAIQPTQLSYLWSIDYFAIMRSRVFLGWRKVLFALAVPALVGLTAIVGPSSAVLMIPRPNTSRNYANRTVTKYSREALNVLYPSLTNMQEDVKLDLTSVNTSLEYAQPYANGVLSPDAGVTRYFMYNDHATISPRALRVSSHTRGPTDLDYPPQFLPQETNATIPTEFIADALLSALYGFKTLSLMNATIAVKAAQPVVRVQCLSPASSLFFSDSTPTSDRVNVNSSHDLPYLKDDRKSIGSIPSLRKLLEEMSDDFEVEYGFKTELDLEFTKVWFPPVWMPSPDIDSLSSLAVLIRGAYLNDGLNISTDRNSSLLSHLINKVDSGNENVIYQVTVCTISAFWDTFHVQTTFNDPLKLTQNDHSLQWDTHRRQTIRLNFTAAESWNSPALHKVWSGRPESSLSAFLAVALSILPSQPGNFRFLNDRPPPEIAASDRVAFNFVTTFYGYGYGTRSTSVYLAMAVLSTYCILTLAYLIYILITGSVSTAWGSGVELVLLALQSRKPDPHLLGHTSVGIDSIKTFSEGVVVRVNEEDELEIVFANDKDFEKRGLRKVERNKEY